MGRDSSPGRIQRAVDRIYNRLDEPPFDDLTITVEPVSMMVLVLSTVIIMDLLWAIPEEWKKRTRFGKATLALSTPLRVVAAALFAIPAIVVIIFYAVIYVPILALVILHHVVSKKYHAAAYKEEPDV